MVCVVCIPGAQELLCSECPFNPANDVPEEEPGLDAGFVAYRFAGEIFFSFEDAVKSSGIEAREDIECIVWTGSNWRTFNPDVDSFC